MECRRCRLLSPVVRTGEQFQPLDQDAQLPTIRQSGKVRRRPLKRILGARRWARARGTPRFCWRELPWWPAFELRVRHGWSAPLAAAWAVAKAPDPVPSMRTLYRFGACLFTTWIRSKGIKLADAQMARLRRRHLIPFYDCTCQDKARCPGLPPPHTRRHDRRGAGGRFEADWDRSPRWAGA
jgi:hypothetical protein